MEHLELKDPQREQRLFTRRLIVAVVAVFLLMGALVARMVYLQVFNYDHYATLSQNNRVAILPLPPTRGLIYDREGRVLAENIPSFTLEIVPEKVPDLEDTLQRLGRLVRLTEEDLKRFHKRLRRNSAFKAVPLRFRLSEQEVARVEARRYQFPGVQVSSELVRHYPYGALAVHAIGYVGQINEAELAKLDASNYKGTRRIGKTGIERYYEALLHGTVGLRRVETNAQGRIIRTLERIPPIPGRHIYLSLDARVQAAAEAALGERRGSVVALDPRNGEVLAIASRPGYDPNPFVTGIDGKTYRQLASSPDRPLFDRALRGRYPPGSTIKPLIGLAGLEFGIVAPAHRLYCPGWYMLKNDDHRYRDWKKTGHGPTDLNKAIRESCDVYFYDLALNLGIDRISSYLGQFGLGRPTGIDLHGEAGGLLPSRAWKRRVKRQPWYPGETVITGIGQGFNLTTPLQLAVATGVLATYGLRFQPQLARAFRDPTSDHLLYIEPQLTTIVPVVEKSHWDYVIRAMREVVHHRHGTAHNIEQGVSYTIAGKTGTAQVFSIAQDAEYNEEEVAEHLRDHALFVAFAPLENPRVVVAVVVENGGSGGTTAAPIARAILDSVLLGDRP